MPIPSAIVQGYLHLTDLIFSRIPQRVPSAEKLRRCKIISHRGDHDNLHIRENTLEATRRIVDSGVWGIELDVRWTRDFELVLFHDGDLSRLFNHRIKIREMKFARLKEDYPEIPTLLEVVQLFGKKIHLMIEVKEPFELNPSRQHARLLDILSPLEPVQDYHLLTLRPEILEPFQGVPSSTKIAISDLWPQQFSRRVRHHRWGGVCGHYLLLRNHLLKAHHRQSQKVGTGFVQSRNCLYRELNRGVDWIFSNDAIYLQTVLNDHLSAD